MPRLRFTVRRMMVAVAIAAVALGGYVLSRRARTFSEISIYHAFAGRESLAALHRARPGLLIPAGEPGSALLRGLKGTGSREARWTIYHTEMHDRYERAARYPWLPVALDPPEPN